MSKRKNNDPGRVRQIHPTRSFEQLAADATLNKLGGYIDEQIQGVAEAMSVRLAQNFRGVVQRMTAIEEILLETVPGLTKEGLANRVANIEDRNDGLVAVDGTVELGDRVRLEIKTRTADQTEFQGKSRFQLDNTGSGNTLGKELETALIGMTAGETKEVTFGQDGSLVASLSVNKVSRKPAAEPAETKEESDLAEAVIGDGSEGAAASAATEETPSASIDAG